MPSQIFRRLRSVPALVRIIVTKATRRRAEGNITQAVFEEQVQRISRDELAPQGLTLLVRELPAGRTRFLIKEKSTGAVCEMMDFASDGSPECEHFDGAEERTVEV